MTKQEYEAEIERLTQGYEDLKAWINDNDYVEYDEDGWEGSYVVESGGMIKQINKITGGEK